MEPLTQGHPSVTVVTMTRGRPVQLQSAMQSVENQCCNHVAEHLVLVDDCKSTWESLAKAAVPQLVRSRFVRRDSAEKSGPRRLGQLRTIGAAMAAGRWIAFIDDDDRWAPNHLHSLLDLAGRGFEAVHCWRQVLTERGEPFPMTSFPWIADKDKAKAEFERLEALGVVRSGDSLMRDSAHPDVQIVDGGCWLMSAELARNMGFDFEYTEADRESLDAEDDKFLYSLTARGVPTSCTEQATFLYYLGGFSNSFDAQGNPLHRGQVGTEYVDWS